MRSCGSWKLFFGFNSGHRILQAEPFAASYWYNARKVGGYTIHDIQFVCGFDVGENKIGKKINEGFIRNQT